MLKVAHCQIALQSVVCSIAINFSRDIFDIFDIYLSFSALVSSCVTKTDMKHQMAMNHQNNDEITNMFVYFFLH